MLYIKIFESVTYNVRKYYDVEFIKDSLIPNIYNGENQQLVDITIQKGDKVRLYPSKDKFTEQNFVIKAIRPLLESSTNENFTIAAKSLWNGSFILEKEHVFDNKNLPFKIINI